jgi:hypothetical protein
MHARPSVVQGALERLVGELVEDKARSALAELRYAPSPAVRERVIEYFRTFLDSPCLAWSEGLGLGLPADHAWSIAVGLSTLSKKDASSRHKRGEEYRLHLRIDYPPLFLPHTVEPLEIAWSASLSGPEPWSGSWTDAAPEAPLVDASQRMRPRKHPMSATLVGLPALVAAIGATMAKTFHVGEATISAGDVSRTAEVRANADEIRMKVRTWLASP